MIRSFKQKGLQRFFQSGKPSGIKSDHAKKLRLIMGRLQAATEANDMNLPGLSLHQLKDRQKGRRSVRVSGNWRVTFRFEPPDAMNQQPQYDLWIARQESPKIRVQKVYAV
jgi:proteic killer suppression protein